MAKKLDLEKLVSESLQNARDDREKTIEAYNNMKDALRIETQDDLQKAMLVGERAVKLLEQLTRANEQIVRLAQIAERNVSRAKKDEKEKIDLNALMAGNKDDDEELGN